MGLAATGLALADDALAAQHHWNHLLLHRGRRGDASGGQALQDKRLQGELTELITHVGFL